MIGTDEIRPYPNLISDFGPILFVPNNFIALNNEWFKRLKCAHARWRFICYSVIHYCLPHPRAQTIVVG